MKIYLKVVVYILLVIGLMNICLSATFSQEEQVVASKELSGKIVSIDLEKSSLVIKQLKDEQNQVYEDVTVYVSDSTVIMKDYEMINLSGLVKDDETTVEYTTDEQAKNIAGYIWIKNKE